MKKVAKIRAAGWGAILGVALLGVFGGCSSPRRGEPITGPIPVNSPGLRAGRVSFQEYCHACHPGGEGGLGPSLNDKPLPGFLVKRQVRWGLGTMPGFDEEVISDEELDELVSYLVALRRAD